MAWVRATAWADRTHLPPAGSLQETLYLMVRFAQQKAEYEWRLTTIKALVGEQVKESWDAYVDAAFPYVNHGRKHEETVVKTTLDHFLDAGPMVIGPEARVPEN